MKDKGLHSRNIHNKSYNYEELVKSNPELAEYIHQNQYGELGVDYSNPNAVLNLNKALLSYHYNVKNWSVPAAHLCPAIPGRVNYIHYIGELLEDEVINTGKKIKGLDIGTGTSCIYPILGNCIYGWRFVASDISNEAINHSRKILDSNPTLKKNIKLRFQKDSNHIFENLIKPDEKFDFTMCNPPFFKSLQDAKRNTDRKLRNLSKNKNKKGHDTISPKKTSNFGGIKAELWCNGGEKLFIEKMIKQSVNYKSQCKWFTTLVSNKSNLNYFNSLLARLEIKEARTIQMNQGNKISHILAWKF